MTVIAAEKALLPGGWTEAVRLTIDAGRISTIETGRAPQPGDERHALVLPGMPNLHSHAFQRAMAGLAEIRGPGEDTFWSWRTQMYRFALAMTPDQVEAVAAQLYVEMLEAGFTRIGEFHYLHHAPDGRPYDDPAELAMRIAAAAATTGIGLTLLPVFYAHGTFGGASPSDGQRRFISDLPLYARIVERCREAAASLPGAVVGVAPHSLRAVNPNELAAVVGMAGGGPIHIHVAEQVKEVEDCLAWSGLRPVQWLLANQLVDDRWCLIHATHITGAEIPEMAATGAVAGLCPVTEANLGDGICPVSDLTAAGGRIGIGTDSNVLIGVADELRQLEYAQRLRQRARNVLAEPGESTGTALFARAVAGGGQALGRKSGLAVGARADMISLSPRHDALADQLLDRWIFAAGAAVDCVWVQGLKQVSGGRHHRREEIAGRFGAAMRALSAA